MGSRIYDIELSCGCMISRDKGGGLIPCDLGFGLTDEGESRELTQEEKDHLALHEKTWKEYKASDEYKVHQEQTKEWNQ